MPGRYNGGRKSQLYRQPTLLLHPAAAIDLRRRAVRGDDDDLYQSVPRPITEQTKQRYRGDRNALLLETGAPSTLE